jgi:hypothetical protein
MLARVTSRELTEWLAYYRLEEEDRAAAEKRDSRKGRR